MFDEDSRDDAETWELNAIARDDESGEDPGIYDHFRSGEQNTPGADEIMLALNALNLAQFQASRHPDDADLQVQEMLARIRWGAVVAEVVGEEGAGR